MTADSAARPADHRSLDAEQVAAFLRANPAFLAARPELLAAQEPPVRVYGDGLTDHLTAMVRAARDRADAMAARASAVLSAGRASSAIAERMQEAIIAVLHAADPAECVTEAWPGLLGVDAAALCCEAIRPRWRTLPQGAVKLLLRGRPVVVRDRPGDAVMLHAEAALLAERDVLVRLPGRQPALLALVSREPSALPATQSWSFLGRVLAALLYGA